MGLHQEVIDEEQLHTFETLREDKAESVRILLDGIADDQDATDALYGLLFDSTPAPVLHEILNATVKQSVRNQV